MVQYFEIPVAPKAKQRPRLARSGKAYTPKQTKFAEHVIRNYIRRQNPTKLEGPISITAEFIFKRPKSVTRNFHTVKPDVDNLLKLLLDGLQDKFGLFEDDKNIIHVAARKSYGDSDLIKVWIKEMEANLVE